MSASDALVQGTAPSRSARAVFAARDEQAPILPPHSVVNRSLVVVIAIMGFLASLTLGAVVLVRTAAGEWQTQVAREVTVQVRPMPGRDIEADVARAADIVRGTPGVAQARAYSKEESTRLLEPWLGAGLTLDTLPVPRMITVTAAPGAGPDLAQMRKALSQAVPGASLDDHRGWLDRMQAMTRAATSIGLAVLGLTLLATVLLVAFATEGAMAVNRQIVEVLHFVGARNRFIAGQVQRHFLMLGLRGALFGAGPAMAIFLGARAALWWTGDDPQGLLGAMVLRLDGFAGIIGLAVLLASVAAITSRATVHRILNTLD